MGSVLSGTEFTAGRHRALLLTLALAASLVLASAGTGRTASAPADPAPIEPAALVVAADLAAAYLVSQMRDDGSFVYRINIDPKVSFQPKYNWLRHAGTLFSLADYQRFSGRSDLVPRIEGAIDHMRRTSMAAVPRAPDVLAIWTDGRITGARGPLTAKLGAAGLGLVAMTALERIKGGSVRIEELRGLARFTLAMQKPDGDFHFKYTPSRGGPQDDWRSLYYPGEVALGLVKLYELDRNPAWLEGARKTLVYLSGVRLNQPKVPADHWALLATRRLWPFLGEADRETFRRHARQVIDSMLAEQIWEEGSPAHGGFAADGRTTPTSTRLEGLIAAEFLFRDEPDYHRRLAVSVSWGIRFLLEAQLQSGPYRGGFTRAIARILTSHPDAPAFNRRATEIRIDYVQHALSAFMQYHAFLRQTDG